MKHLNKNNLYYFILSIVGISIHSAIWVCYDWRLSVLLFFALFVNNLEQSKGKVSVKDFNKRMRIISDMLSELEDKK